MDAYRSPSSPSLLRSRVCCSWRPRAPSCPDLPLRTRFACAPTRTTCCSRTAAEKVENRLAQLVARELGDRVSYTWWPQRRGFVRRTLFAGRCDLVIGFPADAPGVATTRSYYRSTYVFVRRAAEPPVHSFDDPALRRLPIGVHFTGADGNPPPAQALAERHLAGNLISFSIYGDYSSPSPPARLIEAVASGTVDVAVAWGPLAGYFARRQRVPLAIDAVEPSGAPGLPMTFAIAMAVRPDDVELRDRVQRVLDRRKSAICRVLAEYGVPVLDANESPIGRKVERVQMRSSRLTEGVCAQAGLPS
jgi:mxaJ protein